jgi:hypothetical protein
VKGLCGWLGVRLLDMWGVWLGGWVDWVDWLWKYVCKHWQPRTFTRIDLGVVVWIVIFSARSWSLFAGIQLQVVVCGWPGWTV